jgi:hypothetical protein
MLAAPRSVMERRRLAHLILAAVLFSAVVAAVILYRFPPVEYGFYPVCPVYEYLHLECPGCGTTRALAALLHGKLAEAWRLNALAVGFVLPLAAGYGVLAYVRAVRGGAFRWPQVPTPAMVAGVGVIAVFTVLRNL